MEHGPRSNAETNADADLAGQPYTGRFADAPEQSPSMCVVAAVASVTDTAEHSLPPLYEVIDPDALDALFGADATPSAEDANTRVTFEFGGCEVFVNADGWVVVPATAD